MLRAFKIPKRIDPEKFTYGKLFTESTISQKLNKTFGNRSKLHKD